MPPFPEARICAKCNSRGRCSNKSADICYDELRRIAIEERLRSVGQMPRKTCSSYIGVGYNVHDATGNGHCIDMFSVDGHLAHCRDIIMSGKCPMKKPSPYDKVR